MENDLNLRKEYTTVKIPTELARRLDSVGKNLGYTSRAEIVNDAIRRFIELRNREEEDELQRQSPLIKAR
jgi:metal-responsive CopG/Arc/MetJ family transcriptional regulator